MKITSVITAFIIAGFLGCVALFIACNKNEKKANTTANNTKPGGTKPHLAGRLSLNNFQANAISKSDANTQITAYNNDANLCSKYACLFSAQAVLDLLNGSDGITQLHCLLGEHSVNGDNIVNVILCGVDQSGNHIYITDQQSNVYAFDHGGLAPPPYKLQNTTTATNYVNANYQENLSLSRAQCMAATFKNRTTKNTSASTFLFDASDLTNYLSNSPNAVNVMFTLLEDNNGALSMIAESFDNNGNEVYISNNQQTYVFAHSTPCPSCNIANNGASLE